MRCQNQGMVLFSNSLAKMSRFSVFINQLILAQSSKMRKELSLLANNT